MKIFKNKIRFSFGITIFLIAAVLSAISFFSCEVGLGGAVDTQPPSITITNPPVSEVIRDNFALSGTYNDDGKIASVTALLSRTDNKGTSIFIDDFTLENDTENRGGGTWSIPVNTLSSSNEKLIADGTYQAKITITDASGRVTIQNTTFTIDNTPPVLIIQRPATDISVINVDELDIFGKTLSLEGRAADDNDIDHIDVKFYSDPDKTVLIHTVTLKNVPLSIALDVAKWGEENQNYETIYGSTTQQGAKTLYCSIEAYDSAKRYPIDGSAQTDADKNGNCTNEYYLYNDVAGSSIANYKVTELYSIMSGNYTGDGSRSVDDIITSVKEVLNNLKKESGKFRLNPLNNPTYKLSGYNSMEDFITFQDSSITLDIEPGLDGIALNRSRIKPYFYKLDDSGNITGGKIYPRTEDYTITGAASYKIAIKMTRKDNSNHSMSYGKYLVGVEGYDLASPDPNPLITESLPADAKGYPIDIQSVGAAPELTVSYKVNGADVSGNIITVPKLKANGTDNSEITLNCQIVSSQDIDSFKITLDTIDLNVTKANLVKDNAASTEDTFVYNYTKTLKFSDYPAIGLTESKEHTITITASNGSPATDRKTFMYDVEGPAVEIRDVSPIAYKDFDSNGDPVTDATEYLNGNNISFTVSFTDDYTGVDKTKNKPKIEFIQGGVVKSTIASNITTFPYHVSDADTTGLNQGPAKIRVTAYDVAGNKTIVESEFEIDQSTDYPVILTDDNSITNTWAQISNKNDTYRLNVFNQGSQFLLKLIDDDGLKNYSVYSVKVTSDDGSEAQPTEPDSDANEKQIKGTKTQFAWTLPKDAGFYKIWLEVTDILDNKKVVGPFFVQIASGMPVMFVENETYITTVTDTSALSANAKKAPLKVEITIESTEGPFVIKRSETTLGANDYIQDSSGNNITSVTAAAGGTTKITDYYQIPSGHTDGEYQIKYYVTDSNGNPGTKTATYKLDKTQPTISSFKFGTEALNENKWYQSESMELNITASDGTNSARSEISTIEYSLDDTNWTALTKNNNVYTRTVNFVNGRNTLYLRAIDNAGNLKKYSKEVKIDVTSPEFAINHSGNYIYINKNDATQSLILYGTYKDEQSGVDELSVKIDGQSATVKYYDGNAATAPDTESSYKAYSNVPDKTKIKFWRAVFTSTQLNNAFPKDAQGKVTTPTQQLLISGKNLCNPAISILSSAIPNITVMMDIDDPYFQNIDIRSDTSKGVYKKSETQYFVGTTLGNTFTISGIAKDDTSGVQKVTCKIGDASPVTTTTAGWSFTIDLPSTDGAAKDIVLTVYDNAGNPKANSTITVTVDNTAPKGLHLIDSKDKNLAFRIGQQDNDDIAPGNALWDNSLDKDVGGKYSHGTFGNSTTIQVRGNFEEAETASGIAMIYYKVYANEPASSTNANETFETLKTDVLTNYTGRISPITEQAKLEAEVRRVFYNVKQVNGAPDESKIFGGTQLPNSLKNGYYKYYKTIGANFNETISGFTEGQNFLVLVAVDNVGNAAVDVAQVNYNGTDTYFPCYSLNVDKQPPSNIVTRKDDGTAASGIIYSNKTNAIKLWGTVSDTATDADARSGIRSFVLSRDGVSTTISAIVREVRNQADDEGNPADPAAVITLAASDPTLRIWEVNDISSLLPSTDGTVSISATATDNAGTGNTTPGVVATVTVDTTAPTITVTMPDDADASANGTQVNGTIKITGTAEDNNIVSGAEAIYFKQQTANPGAVTKNTTQAQMTSAGWTKVTASAAGTSNWSFSGINTTAFADGTTWFTVAIKDVAGNIAYSTPQSIDIKQDSDRPVITVSQFKKDTVTTLRIKNVYGSLSDDDGNIKKMWYWSTQGQSAPNVAPTATDNKDWTVIPVNGGSWSVDSEENDGSTTWYFAVQDNSGKIFYTNATDSLNRPYIIYNDNAQKQDNTDGISFKYDTNPPTVTSLKLYRAATGTTLTAAQIKTNDTDQNAANNPEWSNLSGIAFGGNYNVLYAKIEVEEGTGMKELAPANGSTPASIPLTISYKNSSVTYDKVALSRSGSEYIYYVGPIVMDTEETEPHEFKVTVEDDVGNKGFITRNIIIDNTAPTEISNVKPGKQEVANGVVNFRGSMKDNDNGSGIRIKKNSEGTILEQDYGVEFFIPTDQQFQTYKNNPQGITSGWLKPTTKGSASWEIEFENLGTLMGYNSSTYSVSADYDDYETIKPTQNSAGSGLYDIPVWFRLTDEVGNVGYNTENSIRYDPNADRPSVQITYPSHEQGKEYIQMGGTITISGMANDDDGISAVYLQFDMDGDGSWENGVNVTGCPYETSGDDSVLVDIPRNAGQKGILANGTKSWYYTINVSQLSGLKYDTDHKTLNVRAIAIEKDTDKAEQDYLYSAWSDTLHISVNNTIPNFTNIKLKRFATAPTAADVDTKGADAEQNYTPDMYLKGSEHDWYFTGQVVVSGEAKVARLDSTATGLITKKSTDEKTMYFAIPISANNQNGGWTTNLHTEDNTTGTPNVNNYNNISINIDSQAPEFSDIKTVNSKTEIKLYKGDYGKTELSSANKVQDSNSWFTFAGKISEAGSGFSRLVFYYERKGAGSDTADRVYNPMEAHGTNNAANRTNLVTTAQNGAVYINDESLPALYIANATRSEENSITADYLKNNANVRVGGLVKIGGVYRRIESIDDRDTDGKITFTPSCSKSYTTVEVIYAMVIDNTGESREGNTIKLDDGDGMVESYQKSGTNYIWDATISSKNIPDGPIEIHCVAFDVAGNNAHGYTTTAVSNNPPRITKVMLGTDLNADGKYVLESEFTTYYALEDNDTTKGTDKWDLDAKIGTEYWKTKKDLVVIPEFVGGSGTIYYKYSKSYGDSPTGLAEAETGSLTGTATIAALKESDTSIVSSANLNAAATLSASGDNKTGAIILKNDTSTDGLGKIKTGAGEDKVNIYRFSFWDSTESCTPGSDSQWAVLNATFMQDLTDGKAPTGTITPFYWESLTKNSVYSSKASVTSVADLEGHIELENDLPASFTASSGEYDKDPKVSGKIKIEGTAYDETRLGSIVVYFANKSVTATYDSTNKNWTNNNTDGTIEISVEDDEGPTQAGHSVKWTVIADTSKVNKDSVCANDQLINLTITDAKPNQASAANYTVDIVPYITGIKTSNRTKSGLKNNNIRSASGKYSIMNAANTSAATYAADFIEINGFNLNPDANGIRVVSSADASTITVTNGSGTKATRNAAAVSPYTSVSISNVIGKSGYLEVFVNNGDVTNSYVRSLNNINKNDAYGTAKNSSGIQLAADTASVTDYSNAYNREPDYYTTKNVQLTDDRYLLMFDMHTARTPSGKNTWKDLKNAYYPVMVMNGDNPVFGYMNGSGGPSNDTGTEAGTGAGGYYPSHAMPQRAEFNGSSGAEIYTEYLIKASAWDAMGMAVDEGGRYYNITSYNRDAATMSLIYDRYAELYNYTTTRPAATYYYGLGWGAGTGYSDYDDYNGNRSYSTGNNAITLDSMNYGDGVLLGRYMYPKLIAKGNSKTGAAKIYMAYYDDGTGQIAFRNFQLGKTVSGTANALDSTHKDKNGTTYEQKINFTENSSNPTANATKPQSIAYNIGRLEAVSSASKYYDMVITSDNHVVIVYYDENNSCLKLIYSTNAVDGSSPTATVDWTPSSVSFPSYTGNYVSMAIDSSNGIHIAAFDASDADLKYFYLPSYSSTTLTNLTVDAAGSVGQWTGIAICNDSDNAELYGKPVISYYNSTETGTRESIKYAYPNAAIGSIQTGIDANGYTTGNWEYMTVPAITPPQGGDSKFQKVCLGFDTNGIPVLGYCATNLEFGKQLGE